MRHGECSEDWEMVARRSPRICSLVAVNIRFIWFHGSEWWFQKKLTLVGLDLIELDCALLSVRIIIEPNDFG